MGHISKNWAALTITDITQGVAAGDPGLRVVALQDCSRLVIENGDGANDIYLQSDPGDSATRKKIPKGNLELDIRANSSGDAVFPKGEIVGYLVQLAGGGAVGPVTITCTR